MDPKPATPLRIETLPSDAPSPDSLPARASRPEPKWRTFATGLGFGVAAVAIASFWHYASRDSSVSTPTIDEWDEAWLYAPIAEGEANGAEPIEAIEAEGIVEEIEVLDGLDFDDPAEVTEVTTTPATAAVDHSTATRSIGAELVQLKIPARVQKASGLRLTEELPCEINVRLAAAESNSAGSNGAELQGTGLHSLDVTCANHVLYDSLALPDPAAQRTVSVYEVAGRAPDTFAYRLTYSDLGGQTGRRQIQLDTFEMKATVFTEGDDALRVELRVGLETLGHKGPALHGLPRGVYKLTRDVRKASSAGALPWPVAEPCVFEAQLAMASTAGLFCKAILSCSGRTLYGVRNSLGPCAVEDRQIIGFYDLQQSAQDRSPALSFDLQTGALDVEDSNDERGQYSVRFERAY